MKNKINGLLIAISMLFFVSLTAGAVSLYYDDGTVDDNPSIDKFVPTKSVKIQESGLARMMENATASAMDSSKDKKSSKSKSNSVKKYKKSENPTGRSYKWF